MSESPLELMAKQVAEFVRDMTYELEEAPMDKQDRFDYVYSLYIEWYEER